MPVGHNYIITSGVVRQYILWYNNVYNVDDVKGVLMLFCDIIDLVFMGSGILIGMIIATGLDMMKCDNCRRRNENE